jgi:hypothetical protein
VIDTDCPRFTTGDDTDTPCVFRIARRGHSHCPWKVGRVLEPHPDPGLGIERHQQRNVGELLQPIYQVRRFVYRSSEKDDAADLVVDNIVTQRLKELAVLIRKPRIDSDMHELSDLFIDGHFLQTLVGECPGFF